MATVTLAKLYERQGHISDALAIYKSVLAQDPSNKEAARALCRLQDDDELRQGVDLARLEFFIAMKDAAQFASFEEWLALWN
ncbi:MAG: tetratricopeptide repeat protein [Helicobacteraceae bacterium]